MKVIAQTITAHNACCGIHEVGRFSSITYAYSRQLNNLPTSGTKLFTSTFINSEVCKQAYEELCENHTLLYQSPVRRNRNSGRKLFLCVFSHGKVKESKK